MTLRQKIFAGAFLFAVLPLAACNPFNTENDEDVYIQTREVQTSLNDAGFRVSDIDTTQAYVCQYTDHDEGSVEEYSFAIFAPFSQQGIVVAIAEETMQNLGISPDSDPVDVGVALRGEKGHEDYYLSFENSGYATFVATTPCHT